MSSIICQAEEPVAPEPDILEPKPEAEEPVAQEPDVLEPKPEAEEPVAQEPDSVPMADSPVFGCRIMIES
jgi:hypothetical protein